MPADNHERVYDWNKGGLIDLKGVVHVELNDETLRDGLQSPSVADPPIEKKLRILHLMERLEIHSANLGLPGAGPRAYQDALTLATEIARQKMRITANCAARTVKADITPIIEISQRAGIPIEAATFIGSSPIRQYVEGWDLDTLLHRTEEAVSYVVQHGLPSMYVTEDTTRSHPDTLDRLYTTAIECGARRIVIADTVGHAIRTGATNVVRFVRDVVESTGESVKVDWHGHNDRGFGLSCALAAIRAGADRIHATALGIGERSGNTQMDLLLVNLRMMGILSNDISSLHEYCAAVSEAAGVPIPFNYPIVGQDAFRTATGVHASAIIKAMKLGDNGVADAVYSGVPAHLVGRQQEIEIGPLSGESNVQYWLQHHGYPTAKDLVAKIFTYAKHSDRILTESEIEDLVLRP